MKDTEKERQHERERAWNKPLSARSRTMSHTGSAGHSPSPRRSSDQLRSTPNSAPRSREHSRPASPSESVRSRATEEGEETRNRERERNWGSPHRWDHQYRPPASPIPGSSLLRPRTQSTHSNGDHTQAQRGLRHTSSQSSLHSEGSSRPSSPADSTHQRQTGLKEEDEEAFHERERNWGSRQQKWTHNHIRKRVASPNPASTHSRVRTNLESDPSAPAASALTRPANGLLKGRPSELSLPAPEQQLSSRHSAPPPELPEQVERDETSRNPMSTSPQLKAINGRAHDKPLRVPSRLPRPDSPLIPPGVNGNGADVKGASPGSATRFGWQFPRSRPQLPEFEPDTSSPERSPSPVHRPTGRIVGSGIPSHIPVRSPGQVPKVAINRNGDARAFSKGHKRATTEFTEANGAVPPRINFPVQPELDLEFTSESESTNAKSPRGLLSPQYLV
jgi:serine/arginine repetitive matrix protein 2